MKKTKVDFRDPAAIQADDPNTLTLNDDSDSELAEMRKKMLMDRIQRQNQDDGDGMSIQAKPAQTIQPTPAPAAPQNLGMLRQMLGAPQEQQPQQVAKLNTGILNLAGYDDYKNDKPQLPSAPQFNGASDITPEQQAKMDAIKQQYQQKYNSIGQPQQPADDQDDKMAALKALLANK